MDKIEIEDYSIVKIATNISMEVYDLIFNTSVKVKVFYYDQYGIKLDETTLIIEGEDYLGWSNDDTYLENLVLNKLGLKKK